MYREHLPCPALRASVECYWTRCSNGGPLRVLPDGCLDILMRRPLHATGAPAGEWHGEVIGTMTRAIVHDGAPAELVGIRFRPGEAFRFLAVAASDATDASLALDDVWGSVARELEEALAGAGAITEQIAIVERALLARLAHAPPADLRLRRALAIMANSPWTVASLAGDLGVGPRQLHRMFEIHAGLGPKALGRVLRLQRALTLARENGSPRWASIAFDAGYFDQPHFTREFNALVGVSPTQYWALSSGPNGA